MDGKKFYDQALRLLDGGQPEDYRSATSRAYYGAFHRAMELLRSYGIRLPKGSECHTKIPQILQNAGNSELAIVAARLATLRSERNAADYQLANTRPERKSTAALNLSRADAVIQGLDQCASGADKDKIRDAARKHAQEVLRLTLF